MKKSGLLLAILVLLFTSSGFPQGVAINNDQSAPDPSAILDVKSTELGFLVPRMTVAQAYAIPNPVQGLLIYATDVGSFLYYEHNNWQYLTSEFSEMIADFDFDTKITTGNGLYPDDDLIEIYNGSYTSPSFRIDSLRIEPLKGSLLIGRDAGRNASQLQDIIAIGDCTLVNNIGYYNIAIGRKSLLNNNN